MGEGNDILVAGNRVVVLDNAANSIYIVDADSLRKLATISMGTDGPNKIAHPPEPTACYASQPNERDHHQSYDQYH